MKNEELYEQIKELEIIDKKIVERDTYLRLLQARRKLEAIEEQIEAISTLEEKEKDKIKKEDREVCAQRVLMHTSFDDLGDIRSVNDEQIKKELADIRLSHPSTGSGGSPRPWLMRN